MPCWVGRQYQKCSAGVSPSSKCTLADDYLLASDPLTLSPHHLATRRTTDPVVFLLCSSS